MIKGKERMKGKELGVQDRGRERARLPCENGEHDDSHTIRPTVEDEESSREQLRAYMQRLASRPHDELVWLLLARPPLLQRPE